MVIKYNKAVRPSRIKSKDIILVRFIYQLVATTQFLQGDEV